jgi:hypothetical protein
MDVRLILYHCILLLLVALVECGTKYRYWKIDNAATSGYWYLKGSQYYPMIQFYNQSGLLATPCTCSSTTTGSTCASTECLNSCTCGSCYASTCQTASIKGTFDNSSNSFVGGYNKLSSQSYIYDFGSGNEVDVTYYSIAGAYKMDFGYWPYTWTLKASNDGSTYTTLSSISYYNTNTLVPTFFAVLPSASPTVAPTSAKPSSQPSSQPSRQPSSQPSRQPTRQPTVQPSSQPSRQPTRQPTGQPTRQPSRCLITAYLSLQLIGSYLNLPPDRQPSSQPSNRPTSRPSLTPSSIPSSQPTLIPTSIPSSQPSSQPTNIPTVFPTIQVIPDLATQNLLSMDMTDKVVAAKTNYYLGAYICYFVSIYFLLYVFSFTGIGKLVAQKLRNSAYESQLYVKNVNNLDEDYTTYSISHSLTHSLTH